MKGSIVLTIGGIVVIGVAAYVIYKHLHPQAKESVEHYSTQINRDEPIESNFEEIKEETSASIKECHAEAAQAINESLQTIFNEERIEEVKTENSDSLDKLDEDLDNLLK